MAEQAGLRPHARCVPAACLGTACLGRVVRNLTLPGRASPTSTGGPFVARTSIVASLGPVLLFTALPTAAAVVGATLAALRPPSPRVQSYVQHFAAGVVFALVGGELLADLERIHTPVEIALGFAAGVAVMLGIRTWTRRMAPEVGTGGLPTSAPTPAAAAPAGAPRGIPWSLVATIGVDVIVDGLLIGIGFAAGSGTGRLLAIALAIELLSLGIAVAVELAETTGSRIRAALGASALALLTFPAAALGTLGLRGAPESTIAAVLAFGAAALLFLVTEELLTEAHAVRETPLSTTMFFAGFLALFMLELYQ